MPRQKKQFQDPQPKVVEFPGSAAPRWMDVNQAAKYLCTSSWQIRQLIRDGEIPHVKMGAKGKYVLDRNDLDEYMHNFKTMAA